MANTIKYGYIQMADASSENQKHDMVEYQGNIYQILFSSEKLDDIEKYELQGFKEEIYLLKYEIISDKNDNKSFKALKIIKHPYIEKRELTIQGRAGQYQQELLQEIQQAGIHSGLDLILCGTKYFEKTFKLRRANIVLGRNLNGRISLKDLAELAEKLGFDVKKEVNEYFTRHPEQVHEYTKNIAQDIRTLYRIKKSENEYNRIADKRTGEKEQTKNELQEELRKKGITNAISLLTFGTEHFEDTFGRTKIGIVLGRTLYGQVLRKDLLDLSKGLGRDLIEEVKTELLDKSQGQIKDIKSLIDYGQNKFAETFGRRIIGIVNGEYSKGYTKDLIRFGENLGRNFKEEIIGMLKERDISCALDLIRYEGTKLNRIKMYLGIFLNRALNSININDKYELCRKFDWDIAKEIAENIKKYLDNDYKGTTMQAIKNLNLKIHVSAIIEKFLPQITKHLGYNIINSMIRETKEELQEKYQIHDVESYQKVLGEQLQKLGLQRIGLIVGYSVYEVDRKVKEDLGKKLGYAF